MKGSIYIRLTLLKSNGVSNHRQFDDLSNSLFRLTTKNTSKTRIICHLKGESTDDRLFRLTTKNALLAFYIQVWFNYRVNCILQASPGEHRCRHICISINSDLVKSCRIYDRYLRPRGNDSILYRQVYSLSAAYITVGTSGLINYGGPLCDLRSQKAGATRMNVPLESTWIMICWSVKMKHHQPLLLTCFNFSPSMNKWLHPL